MGNTALARTMYLMFLQEYACCHGITNLHFNNYYYSMQEFCTFSVSNKVITNIVETSSQCLLHSTDAFARLIGVCCSVHRLYLK